MKSLGAGWRGEGGEGEGGGRVGGVEGRRGVAAGRCKDPKRVRE